MLTVFAAWILGGFASSLPLSVRAALIAIGAAVICFIKRESSKTCLPEARRQIPSQVFGGGGWCARPFASVWN